MTIRFTPWDDRPGFARWRTEVRVVIEADSFAHHVLWEQYSEAGLQWWRRAHHGGVIEPDPYFDAVRVPWEQGREGVFAQAGEPLSGVGAQGLLTCVSLNVDILDTVPVLFYCATSVLVDHVATRNFIDDTFVNARGRHYDATNFHNAIHDIRALNKQR